MDQELIAYLDQHFGETNQQIAALREEIRHTHGVRELIQPAYSALDDRLQLLEAWRERKERDPLEVIRERFGLGKLVVPEG